MGSGDDKTFDPVDVHPPAKVVSDVASEPGWPFPPLAGVAEGPVLRPDGSIVDRPGYDPATRLVCVPAPGLVVPTIPAQLTNADAVGAVAVVIDAIGEFPFDSPASKANAIAGLLTPVVRQYISGHAPLELIDAPDAGSGKTLLSDLMALIATGRTTRSGRQSHPSWPKAPPSSTSTTWNTRSTTRA